MSTHHFDTQEAEKYGINAAVILYNLRFWIDKNVANGKHLHDGEFWTYNSVKAFEALFPYLSKKQIRTALDILESKNVIKSGNYNTSSYDRTKWYCISGYGQNHLPKSENGLPEKGEPIPDVKPDNKPIEKEEFNNSLPALFDEQSCNITEVGKLDEAVNLWNDTMPEHGLSRATKITTARKAALKARLNDCDGIEGWKAALDKIAGSKFLTGNNDRGWKPNFDWVIKESNFVKIMENCFDYSKPSGDLPPSLEDWYGDGK